MKRLIPLAFLAALLTAACAAGENPQMGIPLEGDAIAGFWTGLWHGLITPITFIISLFTDTVNVYEVANNGNWYDFGVVFGLSMSVGGGPAGACGRRRRR